MTKQLQATMAAIMVMSTISVRAQLSTTTTTQKTSPSDDEDDGGDDRPLRFQVEKELHYPTRGTEERRSRERNGAGTSGASRTDGEPAGPAGCDA